MGSIKHIYDICNWSHTYIGVYKKTLEPIYKVNIGFIDDYSQQDLEIYILESHLKYINKGIYTVIKKPYSQEVIKLYDENGIKVNTDWQKGVY